MGESRMSTLPFRSFVSLRRTIVLPSSSITHDSVMDSIDEAPPETLCISPNLFFDVNSLSIGKFGIVVAVIEPETGVRKVCCGFISESCFRRESWITKRKKGC